MTPISMNWKVAHGVFPRFSFLSKVANFKQNESCAQCYDANFNQLDSCIRCFAQGLAFLEKSPISRTTTVSQSVLTPIWRERTVAHGVWDMFYLFKRSGQFRTKRQFRRVIWGQCRSRCFLQVFLPQPNLREFIVPHSVLHNFSFLKKGPNF